jgi:hypothetical protein
MKLGIDDLLQRLSPKFILVPMDKSDPIFVLRSNFFFFFFFISSNTTAHPT